ACSRVLLALGGLRSFLFHDTATPDHYTLPLHDALPIWARSDGTANSGVPQKTTLMMRRVRSRDPGPGARPRPASPSSRLHLLPRSEEHTSELQSRENLVCRLLLEKKKTTPQTRDQHQER